MGYIDPEFPDLNRRSFLMAGAAVLTAINAFPAVPACTLSSEQEEGPCYIDDETVRPHRGELFDAHG
jgi:hypothetical protein